MVARLSLIVFLLAPASAFAWPDTPLGRVEAQAVLENLNVELLTHPSATATLDAWCEAHHLGTGKVFASKVQVRAKPLLGAEERAVLKVGPDQRVEYRRVDLVCGRKVLSEADNWYVPARLTPEMNRTLETTDTPFGRAVADMKFRRQNLSSKQLYAPLAPGWESSSRLPSTGNGDLVIPHEVLQHRAVLLTQAGEPFSLVVETYTNEVLAFDPPGP